VSGFLKAEAENVKIGSLISLGLLKGLQKQFFFIQKRP